MQSIDRCGGMVFVENSERWFMIINIILRVVLRDNKYFQPESGHTLTLRWLTSKLFLKKPDGIVVLIVFLVDEKINLKVYACSFDSNPLQKPYNGDFDTENAYRKPPVIL